jgi:hypothetical protein
MRRLFADLLADPVVRMVMRADHVTEHQLIQFMGVTLSKLGTESETELREFVMAYDKPILLAKPNWRLPCEG